MADTALNSTELPEHCPLTKGNSQKAEFLLDTGRAGGGSYSHIFTAGNHTLCSAQMKLVHVVASVAPTQPGFQSYHTPLQIHKGNTCHTDTPLCFLDANNSF